MKIKKIHVILAIFVMALTIVGCSNKPEDNINETNDTNDTTTETKIEIKTEEDQSEVV